MVIFLDELGRGINIWLFYGGDSLDVAFWVLTPCGLVRNLLVPRSMSML
jgi:hypothetical protein